jgi:hypothetical protein
MKSPLSFAPFAMNSKLRAHHDSGASLRQTYAELYKDRPPADRKFMMDDEAIAILTELYSHGVIDEANVAPVKPILDRILKERPEPAPLYRRSRGGAVR